jgi:hypothetical protein
VDIAFVVLVGGALVLGILALVRPAFWPQATAVGIVLLALWALISQHGQYFHGG